MTSKIFNLVLKQGKTWEYSMIEYHLLSTLVVTQLQPNCNSNSCNIVLQANLSLVRPRPKLIIYLA
jgi:hypothetical protein